MLGNFPEIYKYPKLLARICGMIYEFKCAYDDYLGQD